MKKIGLLLLVVMAVIACSKENENTMYVKASVKGLKKGTFYLQKQVDSMIVSVDSISVDGREDFLMTDEVVSPEMYYLTLGNSSKRISFFGEKDTVYINSQLDLFGLKAKVKGSANQELLDNFSEIQQKFNNQKLDLMKEEFEARKANSQDSIDMVAKKLKSWERKKYLYATNFAVKNANFEVAPYIALTDLFDANIGLLDTINNSLTPSIKESKYGKQLDTYIKKIKEVK
ncbi:DUF4369 domain-containing protein [Lutimonas sp.]|jgi:hypothetical protein|uniref:DUF4369 domain-containing protein n=1 Tax=Lutimonas sp. TaxID=1872403 RepID=UPI003C720181